MPGGLLLCWVLVTGCAHLPERAAPRALRPGADTFAFANETVFAYQDGVHVSAAEAGRDPDAPRYTRNCFVMTRAAIQFWKFARFAPAEPPVTDPELGRRIRRIVTRAPWGEPSPDEARIVFPGYSDLRALSAAKPRLLQENLGSGLATYFRLGNTAMVFRPPLRHQARVAALLDAWLARGYPVALWLYNFPSLSINHVVVVYAREPGEQSVSYRVYDPNYIDQSFRLAYDPRRRRFSYDPTFYFTGGPVSARIIYHSFFQ